MVGSWLATELYKSHRMFEESGKDCKSEVKGQVGEASCHGVDEWMYL